MFKNFNPQNLPILIHRKKISSALETFQILILVAETGSGKTIFVPYLLKENFNFSKIFISQTRRIATVTAAKFLANIMNLRLGEEIGYKVRFENFSSDKTIISFVTDGIFFQEILGNSTSLENTCIILDEFHQRTIYTDLILGLIKKKYFLQKKIKIILMSASGDSEKISNFFGEKIGKIRIPGKLFNTRIFYTRSSQKDFISSICSTVVNLHFSEKIPGDILVFLPGQEELDEVYLFINLILTKNFENYKILKLYAGLSVKNQTLALKSLSQKKRKIILATNVAESSITIPGTRIVVDCGLSRQNFSNWKTGVSLLKLFPISKSEAIQRAGRSGREKEGKCYRLYKISDYYKLNFFPKPEIQKNQIVSIILKILCSPNGGFFEIELIDWPPIWEIKRSLEFLLIIGAIDNHIRITQLGRLISIFPLDIKLARSMIEALREGDPRLIDWISICCSILSMDFYFKIGKKPIKLSERKSDHFFLVQWFYNFQFKTYKKGKAIFQRNIDSYRTFFGLTSNLQKQLKRISETILPFFKIKKLFSKPELSFFWKFCLCLASGFFLNSAKTKKRNKNFYCFSSGLIAEIHLSSFYKTNFPNLIIFHESFISKKVFIRCISPVFFSWLIFFGSKVFV